MLHRLQPGVDSLFAAYLRGDIVRGNAKKCAVGHILKGLLGYADTRWFEAMIAFAQGKDQQEDRLYAAFLKRETGLSIADIWRIDGAFEGVCYHPGIRREATDDSMIERLDRVIAVLQSIDEEVKVPQEVN